MVIVTGVPGWLGNRFIETMRVGLQDNPALSEKYKGEVIRVLVQHGLMDTAMQQGIKDVEIVEGDLTDATSLDGLFAEASGATVFHLAGLIHPKRISDLYKVNVNGTRNILQGSVDSGVKRVIVVSSNSPAGTNPSKTDRFTEISPYKPYMHYGKSKKLAEDLVKSFRETEDIETVVLRPCWFYGPNQPARQSEFFRMIREGKAPIVGKGDNPRSMSYVDNTCQALMLADQVHDANGKTYWIADREPYTMNEIVNTVEDLLENEFGMKVAHKRMKLPGIASEIALAADHVIQGLGLYIQKIHVLSEMNKTIACSVEKAMKELGYNPSVALEEGMRRSIRWCIEKGIAL